MCAPYTARKHGNLPSFEAPALCNSLCARQPIVRRSRSRTAGTKEISGSGRSPPPTFVMAGKRERKQQRGWLCRVRTLACLDVKSKQLIETN